MSVRKLGFTVSFLRTSATEADSFYTGSGNRGEHFEYSFQGYDCLAGIRNLTLGSRAHMVSVPWHSSQLDGHLKVLSFGGENHS